MKPPWDSIASPIAAILVNKYSPRKEQAALLAMWWATLQKSAEIVADRVNTFHDPWHKGHMTTKLVRDAYTPGGVDAIELNLKVASPPIGLDGGDLHPPDVAVPEMNNELIINQLIILD
mgnify:CR=1 FL=1